jgi:uncharacterized protein YlbG (UPF0298 family)
MVNRKGIVIYFASAKVRQEIEKLGVSIVYVNEKRFYMTGYVDSNQFDRVKKAIEGFKNVKKVEESLIEMDNLNFTE